jgi:hypothetical protein
MARKHLLHGRFYWLLPVLLTGTIVAAQTPPAEKAGEELPPPPNLRPFQHALYLSARRGAEWLWAAQRPDGTFREGLIPALDLEVKEDDLLRQLSGTYGLARCARFFGSERYAVRARQAVLMMLTLTKTDPTDPNVRFTVPPSGQANRLAAGSLLVLAIAELPDPGADLVEQAGQLVSYLRKRQHSDGSFQLWDTAEEEAAATAESACYPAWCLLALARDRVGLQDQQASRLAAVAKGFDQAFRSWQQSKDVRTAAVLICAGAELGAAMPDKTRADAVFEMADWLCSLQYGADPRRLAWQGGFRMEQAGSVRELPPTVDSALCAEALAEAARVARQMVDLPRFGRYREACERGLHFLTTIQYLPATTRHFADWYAPGLYGAFYHSPRDGTVHLEGTQRAVCALTAYFRHVVQTNPPGRPAESRPSPPAP